MLVGHIKIHNLPSVAIYATVFILQLHVVQVSWLTFFLLTSLPIQPLNQFFDLVIGQWRIWLSSRTQLRGQHRILTDFPEQNNINKIPMAFQQQNCKTVEKITLMLYFQVVFLYSYNIYNFQG